jgi:thiosulfate/3-mercaptopyruvate sulfurtransferase
MQQQPIISPEWLVKNLDQPAVVVVDCRFSLADPQLGRQQYLDSHIPGAYYLDLNQDLSSPVGKRGGRHPLPDLDRLGMKLSGMGVTPETLVVAYDDSRFAFAARLWWLLRYLGHERVAVLDGGWRNWVQGGYPTATEVPESKLGYFIPQPRPDWIVDIEQVKQRKDLPEVVLVDSRDRDRYLGHHEPIDPVAGHIPGAVNYPWKEVTDEQGYLRPYQQQRWQNLKDANQIIVYCGSGVTACVNLLSLELAQINHAQLYAGSWSDWCSYLET